jgi:hypothetical protein
VAGQEGNACRRLGFRDCHFLVCLQTQGQLAFLSLSRAGGEGTRVFGFGPRRDDDDRVCHKVSATIALWHVPHPE